MCPPFCLSFLQSRFNLFRPKTFEQFNLTMLNLVYKCIMDWRCVINQNKVIVTFTLTYEYKYLSIIYLFPYIKWLESSDAYESLSPKIMILNTVLHSFGKKTNIQRKKLNIQKQFLPNLSHECSSSLQYRKHIDIGD